MPHRLRVVGRVVGDVLRRVRLEIERPEIGRPAAAIALPGSEVLRHRHVDDLAAVRRERGELPVGDRQFLRQPALETHEVELIEPLPPALATRREQHALAVRMPVDHAILHGVVREPRRLPARRGHNVDVQVAVVRRAVGDLRAVRREPWERLFSSRRAQTHGRAALLGHDPDITRVNKRDLILRDRRLPEHPRIHLRVRHRGRQRQRSQKQCTTPRCLFFMIENRMLRVDADPTLPIVPPPAPAHLRTAHLRTCARAHF